MTLAIIVAMDEDGTIGRDGRLPWHLPDDLRRFKRLTMGHVLIMGRRTCDSIGRALPGRRSFVLSQDPTYRPPEGVEKVGRLETALERAGDASRIFVVGGAGVYRLALPHVTELLVTRVHARVPGDVKFPAVAWNEWVLLEEEAHDSDAEHPFRFTFQRFERRG